MLRLRQILGVGGVGGGRFLASLAGIVVALAGLVLAILVLATLTSAAGGCASQGEKMVQSYKTTRQTITDSQQQVDATMGYLTILRTTRSPNLQQSFTAYKEQVDKLESESQNAKYEAKAMRDEQDAHIKAWQKEMETLNDPTMKASLESRRQAAKTNFKLIQMYADDVRNAYEPFVKGNKDLVQALSIDLSPAALQSLSPSIDKILADGEKLKQKLAAMQHGMDNIANGVSPIGM